MSKKKKQLRQVMNFLGLGLFLILSFTIASVVVACVLIAQTKNSTEIVENIKLSDYIEHRKKLIRFGQKNGSETKSIILVEGRKHHLLELCLQNLMQNFSKEWEIHIIHISFNQDFVQNIIEKYEKTRQIFSYNLKQKEFGVNDFSDLIGHPFFWREICRTDRVLLSQTDAWICDNSLHNIEEFFPYDYVGAPWLSHLMSRPQTNSKRKLVGNCGLCLCKRKAMVKVTTENSYENFKSLTKTQEVDVFFAENMTNVCPYWLAKRFAVENVWYSRPFGVHKPFQLKCEKKLKKLEKHCTGVLNLIRY
jgi:hypothetical protein